MADDILRLLFYGEVSPFDSQVEDIEEFRELRHRMSELWQRIEAQATPEFLELLNLYKVCRADMDLLMQLDRFKIGFRLGAQLLTAVGGRKTTGSDST